MREHQAGLELNAETTTDDRHGPLIASVFPSRRAEGPKTASDRDPLPTERQTTQIWTVRSGPWVGHSYSVRGERGWGWSRTPPPPVERPGAKHWKLSMGFFSKKCLKIVFSVFFPSNLTKMETHRFSGTKCQVRENFGSRPPERGGQPPVQN